MNGSLLLDDAALGLLGIGLGVLADHIDTLYDNTLLSGIYRKYFASFTFIVAGIDIHGVAFLNSVHNNK